MDNKKSRVLAVLERNIAGSDLQFSLLVAACSSYRQDTVLRPFPPNYTDKDHNENKEYERLVCVFVIWQQSRSQGGGLLGL